MVRRIVFSCWDILINYQIGGKGTTNFLNLQDFKRKNIVYACISSIFMLKACSLHKSANVLSEGEFPIIDRAQRRRTHPEFAERTKGRGVPKVLLFLTFTEFYSVIMFMVVVR